MQAKIVESIESLADLKRLYMQATTAPLDGMWLTGFVPQAQHYGLYDRAELHGFLCVNDDGCVLQFYVDPEHCRDASAVFESVVLGQGTPGRAINGAFSSTAEPMYLSLCCDHFSSFKVNALMYQLDRRNGSPDRPALSLEPLKMSQLPEAIEFAVDAIAAPKEWLHGYYAGLIDRSELFGLWREGRMIASGESRASDSHQSEYADLGVVVAKSERGRGLATQILKHLVAMNEGRGLRSICSTEKHNISAQTAITRAGFSARHRILQFEI